MKRRSEYHKLREKHPQLAPSSAWLPIGMSLEDLITVFDREWKKDNPYNIDKALSVCTLLIVKRYLVREDKRDHFWKKGWVFVHSKSFKSWVGNDYKDYLKVFEKAGIIEYDSKNYHEKKYPIKYRLSDWVMESKEDARKFKKVPYQSDRTLLRIAKKRVEKWERCEGGARGQLVKWAKDAGLEIDIQSLEAHVNETLKQKPEAFEEHIAIWINLSRLKEGFYFFSNPKDSFGERLHTPFTNLKKEYRKFIRIKGSDTVELDFKNSQLFFLACICINPKAAYEILLPGWKETLGLEHYTGAFEKCYEKRKDFKLFVKKSLDGQIYEYIQSELKKQGINFDREKTKDTVFKCIFSDDKVNKKIKEKIGKVFPTIVELSNVLNSNQKKLLPKLMQRFESRIVIDRIAKAVIEKGLGPVLTVHDSFICHPDNSDGIRSTIATMFLDLGFPEPQIRITAY